MPFKMQSRVDLMQKDTVRALQRAGCSEVWMGVESGSQKILNAMDKGTRVSQIESRKRNFKVQGDSILFLSSVRLSRRDMDRH